MQKAFSIIVVVLCCFGNALGQQLLQPMPVLGEPIGVKQGLSQGMVNSIYQDKEGYLWVGTKDGLNRYDGYHITTYRNNPSDPYSLPDNYCNSMLEDDNGNFWIGTNTKGLCLFDKETERFYSASFINNHLENQCISNMQYGNGQLFVETYNDVQLFDISRVNLKKQGVSAAQARQLYSYDQWQTNPRFQMRRMSRSNYKSLWIPGQSLWTCFTDSIFQLRPNLDFSTWTITAFAPKTFGVEENKTSFPPHFFAIPGDTGKLVICTDEWISCYDLTAKKIYYRSKLPLSKKGTSPRLTQANDGSISIEASIDGDSTILIFHPQTTYSEWMSVKSISVTGYGFNKMLHDKNSLQWFGSPGFGMAKLDTRKQVFKSYRTANGGEVFSSLPSAIMPPIPQEWRKIYECRTSTGFVLDKKRIYWAYLNKQDKNDIFTCLLSYDTKSGVIRKHPGLKENATYPSSVYNDPQDRLWIFAQSQNQANRNRIARIDKATGIVVAEYNLPDDIKSPNNFVSQLYLDETGLMWLATINGLYSFSEKTGAWRHWKNIPGNSSSLSADKLLSICPDPVHPDQYLWIGTEGAGFNRFEKKTGNCIHYDEKDGLPNNVAYCILSDSLNNLWISTNKGLSCFNPVQKTFRNFTDEDGLPGNEFNRFCAMYMPNGDLMFSGVDGFVIFNPKEVLKKQPAAPIVFTGFTIFNKPIHWKTDSGNLQAPPGYAQTLTLLTGQNIFSISFATLEFRNNAKKMYSYKLEGFDKDWTTPGNKNEVTYTNLSPGTYTFYAKGANTEGVWNEKAISLKIIVLPFWYQAAWFKIIVLIMFAAALYGLYRYRLRQLLKLERLRNRIARDLHDEIGSTLSSISIYAESVKKVTTGNPKAENILSRINASTSEMMEAMSDIVWAVNSSNDHFDDLANRMRSFAVQATEAKQIELHFTDNKDLPDMLLNMEQRKNIYLICKEATSNAVKYSNCSVLSINISSKNNRLVISITDNGKGFDVDNGNLLPVENVFGGNGLKNMKVRAAEIGGLLELLSQPGKGTSIIFSMPLKKS